MLKGLKNKDKVKKDTKKDTKNKKDSKEEAKDEEELEIEESTDLVDIEELKEDKTKVKQVVRKKNEYELEEKEIDVSTIKLAKKEEEKPKFTTFQVANSVDEVMKKEFKMESIEHEFMSLTNQEFNKKQEEKKAAIQKENENKPKLDSETGIKFAPLQKTNDQLKLETNDQQMFFNKPQNVGTGIGGASGPAINFTNSAINKEFAPIEKTPQQLRMEEAERREQEIISTKKPTSWIGSKKPDTVVDQKPSATFKVSGWATMATQNDNGIGSGMKFAPLTLEEPHRQEPSNPVQKPSSNAWTASTSNDQSKGQKFAPIQLSEQEKRMQGSRQEQEFVFVSKKDIEERKKKREEQTNNVKVGM